MATDEEVAELAAWLEKLLGQVRQLRINQRIWEEVQRIIAANDVLHKPSHFYAWMRDMYVSGIAMAIRRQLDDDSRTTSLYRFLKRLKGDPSAVSRRRYRALFTEDDPAIDDLRALGLSKDYIDSGYDAVVGEGKPQPDADVIQGEIDELTTRARNFVNFANQVIAHDDRNRPSSLPTFGEVDTVVSYMEHLVQRYWQLMRASHRSMDINFQYDWKAVFRTPWIPPR